MICLVSVHVGFRRQGTIRWEVLCKQKKLAGDSISGAALGAFSWSSWILCFPLTVPREFTSLRVFLNQMRKPSVNICVHMSGTLQELELCTGSIDTGRSLDLWHAYQNCSCFCLVHESSEKFSEVFPGKDQAFSVHWSLQNCAPCSSDILMMIQQCRHTFVVYHRITQVGKDL